MKTFNCELCNVFYDESGECSSCSSVLKEFPLTIIPESFPATPLSEKIFYSINKRAREIKSREGLASEVQYLKAAISCLLKNHGDSTISKMCSNEFMQLSGMSSWYGSEAESIPEEVFGYPGHICREFSVESSADRHYLYGTCPILTHQYGHLIRFHISKESVSEIHFKLCVAEEKFQRLDEGWMNSMNSFCEEVSAKGFKNGEKIDPLIAKMLIFGKTPAQESPHLFVPGVNSLATVLNNLQKHGYLPGDKFIAHFSEEPICCPRCKSKDIAHVEGVDSKRLIDGWSADGDCGVVLSEHNCGEEGYSDIHFNPRWECQNCYGEFNISEEKMRKIKTGNEANYV